MFKMIYPARWLKGLFACNTSIMIAELYVVCFNPNQHGMMQSNSPDKKLKLIQSQWSD